MNKHYLMILVIQLLSGNFISSTNANVWEQLPGGPYAQAEIASFAAMADTLFMVKNDSLYRSRDYGKSWELKYPDFGGRIQQVYGENLFAERWVKKEKTPSSITDGDTVYQYFDKHGIYYSYLNGSSWKNIYSVGYTDQITAFNILRLPEFNNIEKTFLSYHWVTNSSGSYTAIDYADHVWTGNYWSTRRSECIFRQMENIESDIFMSTNDSVYTLRSFHSIGGSVLHPPINSILTIGSILLVSTNDGVFATKDSGEIFQRQDTGSHQLQSAQLHRMGSTVLRITFTSMSFSNDTGRTWSQLSKLPGQNLAVGATRLFSMGNDGQVVYYSADTGRTWETECHTPEKQSLYDLSVTESTINGTDGISYVLSFSKDDMEWQSSSLKTASLKTHKIKYCRDDSIGYVVAFNTDCWSSDNCHENIRNMKTMDNGLTWSYYGNNSDLFVVNNKIVGVRGVAVQIKEGERSYDPWNVVFECADTPNCLVGIKNTFIIGTDAGIERYSSEWKEESDSICFINTDSGAVIVSNEEKERHDNYSCCLRRNVIYDTIYVTSFAEDGSVLEEKTNLQIRCENSVEKNVAVTIKDAPTGITCMGEDRGRIAAASRGNGIYVSEDTGKTWIPRNTGMEGITITDLCVSGDVLVAGSDSGLFISSDFGNNWMIADDGLPCRKILSVTVFRDTVFVSVENAGVWKAVIDELKIGVAFKRKSVFREKLTLRRMKNRFIVHVDEIEPSDIEMSVYTLSGRLVEQKKYLKNKINEITILTKNLTSGTYIVSVKTAKNINYSKGCIF